MELSNISCVRQKKFWQRILRGFRYYFYSLHEKACVNLSIHLSYFMKKGKKRDKKRRKKSETWLKLFRLRKPPLLKPILNLNKESTWSSLPVRANFCQLLERIKPKHIHLPRFWQIYSLQWTCNQSNHILQREI